MPYPGDEPTGLRHDRPHRDRPFRNRNSSLPRDALCLAPGPGGGGAPDLASLRRETEKAKQELTGLRTAQLLEVNDRLVQAAVQADTAAQTAVSSLDALTRLDPARRAHRRHPPGC